jgi:D-glycero-D-manno-heptose 1,7-bisphosphate phosphatase
VINESIVVSGKPYSPIIPDNFKLLAGVKEALKDLRKAGYLNVIVTNQPDVSTGKQSKSNIEAIHNMLCRELPIDLVMVCYHVDEDNCLCRKPRSGMLIEAAIKLGIDISQSFMVGDRWRDVACGQEAGCKEVFFIDYGYNERTPEAPFTRVDSLLMCAKKIIEKTDR